MQKIFVYNASDITRQNDITSQLYKGSTALEPRTSDTEHGEAEQQDQPTDQWLPDNDTRAWTADAGKIPCEGQQG